MTQTLSWTSPIRRGDRLDTGPSQKPYQCDVRCDPRRTFPGGQHPEQSVIHRDTMILGEQQRIVQQIEIRDQVISQFFQYAK